MKKAFSSTLKVYGFTWLIIFIWFIIRSFTEAITLKASFSQLIELLSYKQFVIAIHVFFGILYILFLLIRYFAKTYQKYGFLTMIKRLILRAVVPVFLVVFSIKYIIKKNSSDSYEYHWVHDYENVSDHATSYYKLDGKHRGMSVFGWHYKNQNPIAALIKNNVEWVAMVPFLHQKDEQAHTMSVPTENGIWSRRDSVFINNINKLHSNGINVMLKPHLWLMSGWRSNLNLPSKSHWKGWFETYRSNMLHYAEMAEITNVKLLCIGTELRTSIDQQPEQWNELIQEIREIYSGELTYAANWDDDFDKIDFWKNLDYIGVQAYFPLTENESPEINEIKAGWDTHIDMLASLSHKHNKPILFTEIGYRSDVSTTIKPWEWNSISNLLINQKSDKAQQLAYEAMFAQLWDKEWFSGCYLWEWNTQTSEEHAKESFGFSPRFKPAENTIAKWYQKVVIKDSLNSNTSK